MMRFIKDLKKYNKFTLYSAKSELKAEIASSHLSWLWWILDPLLFMMVYSFISLIVFQRSEPYFPVFVFIGLSCWTFFEKTVKSSVKLISSNRNIVTKVYIPKFILLLQKIYVNGFKMMISFALVVIMMIGFQVPVNSVILFVIPLMLTLFVITFGFGMILMHFGVFVEDLFNIITVLLKLVFYMSGIFYNIVGRVPEPYNQLLLKGNPMALLITDLRQVMLYRTMPHSVIMLLWLLVGIIVAAVGIKIVYKYENSYVKVI